MSLLRSLTTPTGLAAIAAAILFTLLRWLLVRRPRSKLPLPPGPPAEPILGHLRIIPSYGPEYAYMRWSKEYKSDIISFHVLGQPVIVLNTVQAAVEILDKRGANYCDRPRFALFEIMGWKKVMSFTGWGPTFRLHRRILQRGFQKSNITQYQQLQQHESLKMLKAIVENRAGWESILRRFATAVVLGIGFGIRVESEKDAFVKIAEDASFALANGGAPGGTPVDFFPFLRWLPRMFQDKTLRFANDWSWAVGNLLNKPYEAVLAAEQRERSMVKEMLDMRQHQLEEGQPPELSHDDIKGAGAAIFAAGEDTTWSTLVVFILNMLLHPEVQRKAQNLLDEVVGRDRLPTFQDRPRLRYVDLIVQETLRWCPVSPIGLPHKSLKDDVYNGYQIPAGSIVLANARAMTHDEATYSDPDTFNPDRYLPVDEGGLGEPFPTGNFGFGRRICVGKYLAEANLFIVMACTLSTMFIGKEQDLHGNEIEPVVELTQGLTSHPKRYPCKITPRDERALAIIRQSEA